MTYRALTHYNEMKLCIIRTENKI